MKNKRWKFPTKYALDVAATVPAVEFHTNVESSDRRLTWNPRTGELAWREPKDFDDGVIELVALRDFKRRLRALYCSGKGKDFVKKTYGEHSRRILANYFCAFAESVDPARRRLRTGDWKTIFERIDDIFERIENANDV